MELELAVCWVVIGRFLLGWTGSHPGNADGCEKKGVAGGATRKVMKRKDEQIGHRGTERTESSVIGGNGKAIAMERWGHLVWPSVLLRKRGYEGRAGAALE